MPTRSEPGSPPRYPSAVALLLYSDGPGGAERMLFQLAVALHRRGRRVVPIGPARGEGWLGELLQTQGLALTGVRLRAPLDPWFLAHLVRLLRRHQVAVVHSHEFTMAIYGAAAAALLHLPHIITLHGGRYFAEHRRRRTALRWACRHSHRVVAVSQAHARLVEETLGLAPGAVEVVPNGIVPAVASGADVRTELGLSPETVLLLAVGNLYPVKGYDVLLRALAGLRGVAGVPPWHLVIAGRGGEESNLRSLADELGVGERVSLVGLRSDVGNLLAAADLYVLPSRAESHPLALLEAMFAACPTVASAVGGIPDSITNGQEGLLVPPDDPAALRAALLHLLVDPPLRRQMGAAARQRAQREFTLDRMVDAYERLYASATVPDRG